MLRKLLRYKSLTVLFFFVTWFGYIFLLKKNYNSTLTFYSMRDKIFGHINNLRDFQKEKYRSERHICKVPRLEVNSVEIMSLLKPYPKVDCKGKKDWVELNGSTLKIRNWVKEKYGEVQCGFTDILRVSDYTNSPGVTTLSHTEYNLDVSDVVQVDCTSKSGGTWKKIFTGIRSDQDIFDRTGWAKVPDDSLKLNFLMFGFDSMSHNMWKRKLPKTYKYATENLKGVALDGYNILGDGTTAALIPILTGRTELELPEARKKVGKRANFVDVYPFIWNDYHNNGYVTAWGEDLAYIGTFTYRLTGFKEQPVDHYMRTYYIQSASIYKTEEPYCYGELSRYQIMLNFMRNMYEVYKDRPKFVFGFHSEYSHDDNDLVANADDDTFEWLQEFNQKGYLNNTMLILLSDHGSRFASFRNTLQGKQEERLPGVILVVPSWFPKKYPKAYENLKINSDRLTTPFDLHETIKNVLHFEGDGMGSLETRANSLFKEIPLNRTCTEAMIDAYWCTCLDWETLPTNNYRIVKAVGYFVNFLNQYTAKHRDLCAELHLKKIVWGAKLIPNNEVIRTKFTDSVGNTEVIISPSMIVTEVYQFKVVLSPDDMLFEASVRYRTSEKIFLVSTKDISRIDRYRRMTHCIEDAGILQHLRKFCNCLPHLATNYKNTS